MEEVYILGVKVNTGMSEGEVLSKIDKLVSGSGSNIVCTTNPEFVMAAQKDEEFKQIINNSAMSLPDGWGVVLASRYFKGVQKLDKGTLFPVKAFFYGLRLGLGSIFGSSSKASSGSDLVPKVCEMAANRGYSVFFLGGWPKDFFGRRKDVDYDLAEKVSSKMSDRFSELKVVGASSNFSPNKDEDSDSVDYIKDRVSDAGLTFNDIVFAAYPHGVQEKWLNRNLNKIPVAVGIGVGGSFDYLSGEVRRAPGLIKKIHLEWLYRLIMQPWRIKRIIMAFPVFPIKIYLESIKAE